MATSPSKAEIGLPLELQTALASPEESGLDTREIPASGRDALQALLAFSALHDQVRQRRTREASLPGAARNSETSDQFMLFEVLQLVAERALALTGADGIAIALVHEGEMICRAASGPIAPDVGAKLDPSAGFSGLCLRTGESIRCDDAENDARVNRQASHRLHARSILAVPLCGRYSVVGLIEAFSSEAYSFTESDLGSLKLLAELILGAMKPEEQQLLETSSPVAMHGRRLAPEQGPQPSKQPVFPVPERTPALGVAQLNKIIEQQVAGAAGSPTAAPSLPAVKETKSHIMVPEQATGDDVLVSVTTPATPVELNLEMPATTGSTLPITLGAQSHTSAHLGLKITGTVLLVAAAVASAFWWRSLTKTAAVAAAPVSTRPQLSAAAASAASPAATTLAGTAKAEPISDPAAFAGSGASSSGELPGRVQGAPHGLLPMITGVRHWESGDSTTVVIDLQDQVQYEVHRLSDPERIYFDLHDTLLGAGLSGKTFEVGDSLLVRIRVAQPMPGVSRIVLETRDVSNFSVSLEQNPFRLVASIRKQAPSKGLGAKLGAKSGMPRDFLQGDTDELEASTALPSKEDLQLRARVPHLKIAVDAGHGGWDLGTVGREGLLEKDLVLDVAQRLGASLSSRLGAEVLYTRPDDNYIPLEQRAEMANDAQADLFISVHANNSDYAFARGVETYYTNFSSSPESAEIEKRENATAKSAPSSPSLTGVALKERTDQSRRLATSIERALYGTLAPSNPGLRDRGVKEAGFVVLTSTSMPAVLTEIAFVSSPMDEKNLQSASYRQHIAEAIYKGIARYAAGSTRVKIASVAGKPTGR